MLSVSAFAASHPPIEIEEYAWAGGIDKNRNPNKRYNDTADSTRALYFWTRLRGSQETLDYLRAKGKLPLRHLWLSYLGADPELVDSMSPVDSVANDSQKSGPVKTDSVALSIGKRETIRKLGWQLQQKGYFEWRTWSSKSNILPGWWKVRIVYSDGEPVLCGDAECEYYIEID